MTKINVEKLYLELKRFKNILILTHDNPDPDAICTGALLRDLFKHYGVSSTLAYGGVLKRRENLKMVDELKIDIKPIQSVNFSDFDGFALVDTQKLSGNHSLPERIGVDFTVDHHCVESGGGGLLLVNEKVGASSTILVEYFEFLGKTLSESQATAYCYSIIADTKEFSREYCDEDILLYKKYIQLANLPQIARIKQAKKPLELYDFLKIAMESKTLDGNVLMAYLGAVSMVDFVPEIADIFSGVEDVETVLIVGQSPEGDFIGSARTSLDRFDLSKILSDLARKHDGKGGGHHKMSGCKFKKDYEGFMKRFLEEAKVSESQRISRKTC